METMQLYLDMDGTIADLYSIKGWKQSVSNNDATPYIRARPMVSENVLLSIQQAGYTLSVISWLAPNISKQMKAETRRAKREWLKQHYPNVKFDKIHIVKYGTNKWNVAHKKDATSVLVDDEMRNRIQWKGVSIEPTQMAELIS